jgi:hypothetical protein
MEENVKKNDNEVSPIFAATVIIGFLLFIVYKANTGTQSSSVKATPISKTTATRLAGNYIIRGSLAHLCATKYPHRKRAYNSVAEYHQKLFFKTGEDANDYAELLGTTIGAYGLLDKSLLAKSCKELRLKYAPNL